MRPTLIARAAAAIASPATLRPVTIVFVRLGGEAIQNASANPLETSVPESAARESDRLPRNRAEAIEKKAANTSAGYPTNERALNTSVRKTTQSKSVPIRWHNQNCVRG